MKKIYSISYIRATAMLLIVLYHCYCFTAGIWFLDRHSMGVYVLHHIVIFQILFYIPSSHAFLNAHTTMGPLLLFVAMVAVSLMLSWIIEKIHLSKILF